MEIHVVQEGVMAFNRLTLNSSGEIVRAPVSSTNLQSEGYDPQRQVLEIEFEHLGEVYRYFGVSRMEYESMLAAQTPGQHFYHYIRLHYPYVRLQ
jgi:hypothetical protein